MLKKPKSEIMWTPKCITSGYCNNSCSDMNKLFQSMFPDSAIAESFQLGSDKIRYITNYGIAPYFKCLLIDSLKKIDYFVVSFDESLNDVLRSCEIDLLLRCFDSEGFAVKIRYYDSRFFGHATHQDLVKHSMMG